jgi:iron complex transport system ATP-binding protein
MLAARNLGVEGRLAGITSELRAGEITAICGPNGAGKSSLLACLAGLLAPGTGTVTLGGKAISAMASHARAQAIGFLPQNPEVAWDVSVEVLASLGRLPWPDADDGIVASALEAMDLTNLRARPVSSLSGGERARALMARVLAGEPRWILADEPLANLDLGHAAALIASLRSEARGGRGVVLVMHDLALAMNHADRVLVLDGGRLVSDGKPEVALSEQAILRTWGIAARWLGEPGARALSLSV